MYFKKSADFKLDHFSGLQSNNLYSIGKELLVKVEI